MLVNIYGSKELFVNEYRTLLADRLLAHFHSATEREIRNLELLKLRFGEQQLHYCEVMLKDVADSKRINAHIADHQLKEAKNAAARKQAPQDENRPVVKMVTSETPNPPSQTGLVGSSATGTTTTTTAAGTAGISTDPAPSTSGVRSEAGSSTATPATPATPTTPTIPTIPTTPATPATPSTPTPSNSAEAEPPKEPDRAAPPSEPKAEAPPDKLAKNNEETKAEESKTPPEAESKQAEPSAAKKEEVWFALFVFRIMLFDKEIHVHVIDPFCFFNHGHVGCKEICSNVFLFFELNAD